MRMVVLYVGSSLLAPLKNAERELNRQYDLNLKIATYNFGAPLTDDEWHTIEQDLQTSAVVFAIHVIDGENGTRLIAALDRYKQQHAAVIVINCMPDLMRRTRMGRLDVSRLTGMAREKGGEGNGEGGRKRSIDALSLLSSTGSWVGRQVRRNKSSSEKKHGHGQYLKLIDKLPSILRFVPDAGGLRDVKNYLNIFCYFLQPTPPNIRSMVLYALKEYVPDERLTKTNVKVAPPERLPSIAIYHPDAPRLFESFAEYRNWYLDRSPTSNVQRPTSEDKTRLLGPDSTIGLLLMRPQVISKTTKHYDALIRAIEAEGLSVIPALSTLMDNREAVSKFFVATEESNVKRNGKGHRAERKRQITRAGSAGILPAMRRGFASPNNSNDSNPFAPTALIAGRMPALPAYEAKSTGQALDEAERTNDHSRVSQIVSLTGFSFVGGPAMNDSEAAAKFLQQLNRPYRSAVSLDTQTIDSWSSSQTGLNPIQSGMQIAIPEIDGATEPFIYGGIPARGVEPIALDNRCARFARRLKRWNRLRTAPRKELKLALILFCFPPNKGNIGTAADLDVFPGLLDTLHRLKADGYDVDVPASADALRELVIGGNAENYAAAANVAYSMKVDDYRRLCPYVTQIEQDWGPAPGNVNSFDQSLTIQGVQLGNVFIGVQPTFGYEGDPMRLMMARSGAPHHGFMAFYTYLSQVLDVDAVVHVGTHGATEFMPGKQVGLSDECWPDRLIGELPNIYLYSINNPSEGSIAKRRSYAELISYLTPPIENAGLYRDLSTLKDLVMSYRQSTSEEERVRLYESIDQYQTQLHFSIGRDVTGPPV